MNTTKQFVDVLRQAGFRITSQRIAICRYLAETRSHPTPSQVFEAVHKTCPEISRATVYNTLNTLRDLGAIVEVSGGSEHTQYDTNTSPHINLVCLGCGQVTDLENVESPTVLTERIFNESGFRASSLQVQAIGFCPACQEAKRNELRERLHERSPHRE